MIKQTKKNPYLTGDQFSCLQYHSVSQSSEDGEFDRAPFTTFDQHCGKSSLWPAELCSAPTSSSSHQPASSDLVDVRVAAEPMHIAAKRVDILEVWGSGGCGPWGLAGCGRILPAKSGCLCSLDSLSVIMSGGAGCALNIGDRRGGPKEGHIRLEPTPQRFGSAYSLLIEEHVFGMYMPVPREPVPKSTPLRPAHAGKHRRAPRSSPPHPPLLLRRAYLSGHSITAQRILPVVAAACVATS